MRAKLLAERIRHERDLREAEAKSFDHERELRAIFDGHERELRKQVEDATARNLERQALEYERRLADLNHAHTRTLEAQSRTVSREIYESQHREVKEQVGKLVTQIGVWRGIIVFLGLPGIIALLWAVLSAISGHTVTGPDGFLP